MDKKTIWIINDYAGSPYHGMVYRNYYLAQEWNKKGYKVYIISASYSHFFKKLPKIKGSFTFENINNINYLWIKVPHYKDSWDKKRILKWFVFSIKLLFIPFKKMKKPDIIIASATAPFFTISTYKLAKRFNAKFIFEVRDIWPLTLIEIGNISPKNPLIQIMSYCEKFAIKNANHIVSSLQNYNQYLKKDLKINKDFIWINNGILKEEMKKIEELPTKIKKQIPKDKFIVGYTGTTGIANALDSFLESAMLLKKNKKILFVIVGDGKEKENLVKKYKDLENVLFIESIKKSQVQSMLELFDACYIGLKKKRLFEYGVSPNKLFDYMYSAKPIIYAIDSGENNIVKLAKCGIVTKAENPHSIASAIKLLSEVPKWKLQRIGENGKRYVLEHFTYEKLAIKFIKAIESEAKSKKLYRLHSANFYL